MLNIMARRNNNKKYLKGLTLVEMMICVVIMGTFALMLVIQLSSSNQLDKVKNTQRQYDIKQIANSVELFYQDNNCYPLEEDMVDLFQYGSEWSENSGRTVYNKKIPIDPDNYIYVYKTDTTDCPQWSVVFSKLSKVNENSAMCPLASIGDCVPQGYDNTWACVNLGTPNCEVIAASVIEQTVSGIAEAPDGPNPTAEPTNIPQVLPTNTPTPTSVIIPPISSPTPTPNSCVPKDYGCRGTPLRCNVVSSGTGEYCNSDCDGAC